MIHTVNPSTEETLNTYYKQSIEQVARTAKRIHKGWISHWSVSDHKTRRDLLLNIASNLRADVEKLALLMTTEMGKPIAQSRSEIEKCAWVCEYYASEGSRFMEDRLVDTGSTISKVVYRPIGTVLAIMPWNYPFWQVFRFLAPCLMAGNTAILKHSSSTTGCSLAIRDLLLKSGAPDDVFDVVIADNEVIAELIGLPEIAAVTLTGSTRAGSSIAATAGQYIKKCVLELGGSDPYLVLEDADVDLAIEKCTTSRMLNNGQSCIAAKRFIVDHSVYDSFVDGMTQAMSKYTMGDPRIEETRLGAMAREDLRDELHEQVKRSVNKGARCLLGGEIPDRSGWFYPATVLADVKPGMAAFDEELFGPVAAIIKADDTDHAIQLANATNFGLGAAVFSKNIERALNIAENSIQAGNVFINDFVRSDPRLPFGGIKESGYGRELSEEGIREFMNAKTILSP